MKITEAKLRKIIRKTILAEDSTGGMRARSDFARAAERDSMRFSADYDRIIPSIYEEQPDWSAPFRGYNTQRPRLPIKPEALEMIKHGKKATDMGHTIFRAAKNYMEATGLDDKPSITGATTGGRYGKVMTFFEELQIVISGIRKGDIK